MLRFHLIILFFFCGFSTLNARDFDLLGSTASAGTNQFSLVEIDQTSGDTTLRGPANFNTGLDFTSDYTTLYSASTSLRTLDPLTGTVTTIGELNFEGATFLSRSLTVSPQGRILLSGGPGIFEVDPTSAELTFLGSPGAIVFGIEFDSDGRLFGGAFDMFELSPVDGSIIRTLGGLDNFIIDLDFSPDGDLFGISSSEGALYSIDLNGGTGNLDTLITQIDNDNISSIASLPTAVPEPAAGLGMFLLGLTVAMSRRRN